MRRRCMPPGKSNRCKIFLNHLGRKRTHQTDHLDEIVYNPFNFIALHHLQLIRQR